MIDLNSLPLPQLFDALTGDGCLERLLDAAFAEDLPSPGDITTRSIIKTDQMNMAKLVARQPGVVAGLATLPMMNEDDEGQLTTFDALIEDGEKCVPEQAIAEVHGTLRDILPIERIVLNIVGRLSGIATLTRQYVDLIAGTKAVICDTRKTTPGMRNLEKYAVRCGGGVLHRLGLHDAALYKDNHLAAIPLKQLASKLDLAIRSVREKHDVRFVEVEVDTLDQLREVLGMDRGLVDIVLLDNMNDGTLRECVHMRNEIAPTVLLEASGGVNLFTVRPIAETGVDRISVGAITHSAPCLDVGLDID